MDQQELVFLQYEFDAGAERARITPIIDVYDAGQEIAHTVEVDRGLMQATPGIQHFRNEDGSIKARVLGFLIEIGDKKILIDTCVGDGKTRRDFKRWHKRNEQNLLKNLARAGVSTDDITHVFCTHFHQDHVGWNTRFEKKLGDMFGRWVPTFKKASYLFSRKEYQSWDTPSKKVIPGRGKSLKHILAGKFPDVGATQRDSIKPIIKAGLADWIDIEDGKALLDDLPQLTLISTPGHTHDHASLMLKVAGLKIVFTGDAFHHPIQMVHTDLKVNGDISAKMAIDSREKLLNTGADIYFGPHFDATAAATAAPDPKHPGKHLVDAYVPVRIPPFMKG